MAKALRAISKDDGTQRIIGQTKLRSSDGVVQPPNVNVRDGDTINVELNGYTPVRFLGIDTAEKSFAPAGTLNFKPTNDPHWVEHMQTLFNENDDLKAQLGSELVAYLEPRLNAHTAENQHGFAIAAQEILTAEVENDISELGQTKEDFQFFHHFSHEVMDGYARLLCYINRDQKEKPRPKTYNERLLQKGAASPYFIWPNVNPFQSVGSKVDAVPTPGNIVLEVSENGRGLKYARESVRQAREQKLGIFSSDLPLLIEPFEFRYLAHLRAPKRWLIDLSHDNDVLIRPENYIQVPNIEDRLFVSDEYIPLFESKGWKRQGN